MEKEGISDATEKTVVQNSEKSQEKEKDQVSYETHQRLLRQLKKSQEQNKLFENRISDFEQQQNEILKQKKEEEEKKLQEKGEFKKLLEFREQEIEKLKSTIDGISKEKQEAQSTIADTVKLHAFYEKLPGKIKKREYLNFVNIDKIILNPETGEIESSSVDEVVNNFMGSYSELVDTSHMGKLPTGMASNVKNIDYDNWKTANSKDMKKNLKEIMQKKMQSIRGT